MRFLYIDEAGCLGALPSPTSPIQPILCILGIIVPEEKLYQLTIDFLSLKRRFSPYLVGGLKHDLEIMLHETKGSELRSDIRNGARNYRRRALGILDHTVRLLEQNNCNIIARAYVKQPGGVFIGKAVYTAAIQILCMNFEKYLTQHNDVGFVIADSREKIQNENVSFSVFTKKFQKKGDEFPRLKEMPVFGHSNNHVGLQIADLIVSGILFPMISYKYCTGYIRSVHCNSNDSIIYSQFIERIKNLRFLYQEGTFYKGGITVIDAIAHRPQRFLFE